MHLQQMLRQDRVTLKKDTLFHTDSLAHMHALLHKLGSVSERASKRDREGEFYFQEVFCAYLRGETIERESKRRRRGRDCVSERVKAGGELAGESGWESATERGEEEGG